MYEGYKNQLLSRNGDIWQTSYRVLDLRKSDQKFTMNITDIGKTYPVGHVSGHLSKLNG